MSYIVTFAEWMEEMGDASFLVLKEGTSSRDQAKAIPFHPHHPLDSCSYTRTLVNSLVTATIIHFKVTHTPQDPNPSPLVLA